MAKCDQLTHLLVKGLIENFRRIVCAIVACKIKVCSHIVQFTYDTF